MYSNNGALAEAEYEDEKEKLNSTFTTSGEKSLKFTSFISGKTDITSNKNYVEGNWETKFKIEPVKDKKINCNLELDEETIYKVTISPLGVVVNSIGINSNISSVEINMVNGSTEVLDESIKESNDNKNTIRFISSEPLNMEYIKSITVNGETISME